jgi:hypothetical protein
VRRMIQVFALLMVILTGSLPGAYLLGAAHVEPCCATKLDCPCPMPAHSPGPTAPGLAATAPATVTAPCLQAQIRPSEPSPLPSTLAWSVARFPLAEPSVLARPGPTAPPGPTQDRHALLSVFRI